MILILKILYKKGDYINIKVFRHIVLIPTEVHAQRRGTQGVCCAFVRRWLHVRIVADIRMAVLACTQSVKR